MIDFPQEDYSTLDTIKVTGGMICGFDSDDPEIFRRQSEFAMYTPVPFFTVGPLVAPAATPLHARRAAEGRLVDEDGSETAGELWKTNIVPKRMSHDQLLEGVKWLCNRIYDPKAYLKRVMRVVEILDTTRGIQRQIAPKMSDPFRPVELQGMAILPHLALKGPAEARMVWKVLRAVMRNPALREAIPWYLIVYMQVRDAYERGNVWVPGSRWARAVHRAVLGTLFRLAAPLLRRSGLFSTSYGKTGAKDDRLNQVMGDCPSLGA